MNVEDRTDPLGDGWGEGDPPQGQILHLEKIGGEEVPHQEARGHDAQEQQEREVIGDQGDVAQLGDDHPAEKQKRQSRKDGGVAQIEGRDADLEETVDCREAVDPGGDRFDEETQVPKDNDQQRPMEEKPEKPEPFGAAVDGPFLHDRHFGVPEERPEKEDLQGHPPDHAPNGWRGSPEDCS